MSERAIGPWRVRQSMTAFDNPWIKVRDHSVIHPDGSPGEYGVVHFKNVAIGILPIDEDGHTWLVGQHRFPADKYSWELPEGGGPIASPPLQSAKRELLEETGLEADHWRDLLSFDVSNSVTDERAICYLAWGLRKGENSPDASEELTLKRIPFRELFEMVIKGEISDSLTIVMTLTAHAQALRGALPAPISRHMLESV